MTYILAQGKHGPLPPEKLPSHFAFPGRRRAAQAHIVGQPKVADSGLTRTARETFVPYHRSIPDIISGLALPHLIPAKGASSTSNNKASYFPKSTQHVSDPNKRAPQEQRERQKLSHTHRQLQQTKHQRIRWHTEHHCLEQRAHNHHGAAGVQQEVCCCRRRWMRKDLPFDQLQPGSLPRGEYLCWCSRMTEAQF